MTTTIAPAELLDHRKNVIRITGLSGDDVGLLPDPSHKASGGYHCGVQDIINIGRYPDRDYSTRQSRDRIGGNVCSAEDIGDDWPKGGRAAWIRFNNLLVAQMIANDPELAALRAINFTPNGTARKRYDTNNRSAGIINSTDTVYMHTHLEWWRNTSGTALRARSLRQIEKIMQAAIDKPIIDDLKEKNMQILVRGFAPDTRQVWLADGMIRRAVPNEWIGSGNGPITNAQVHASNFLGNLGNSGQVFVSGGDPDVWGIDVATLNTSTATTKMLQDVLQLLQAGGGNVEATAILAKMAELASQEEARDNALKQENAELKARLAAALGQ